MTPRNIYALTFNYKPLEKLIDLPVIIYKLLEMLKIPETELVRPWPEWFIMLPILKSGVNTLLSPYVTFFISLSGATHIAYGCFRVILNCASSLYFMDLEYFQEFVKSTLNLFFDKIKIARSPTTPYLNSNRTKIYTRLCLSME